ncbi:MAG TPA: ABC transporter ATP-binding protein [Fimbriimonadaceae bacterium]|nr:ABC transporter ATP-binding protein [Fimbriimonadaceae bacterium]
MEEPIIEIKGLTRRFGRNTALNDIDLTVRPGIVMGLVGENGAGKTTLIKHVLGLLCAQEGSVRVFGKDPVANPESVLSQIGYLSEEGDLPMWMRVRELIRYAAAFYPTWDMDYAQRLLREFSLDPDAKLSKLSKGQRSRAGLLVAMAYRPQLLLLDEPSSGLDPIVRRDILGAIIRTIADDGRTVLFSSHLLSEVERVSDRIAILKSGRILLNDTLENVKQRHVRVTLLFSAARESPPDLEGSLGWSGGKREWSTTYFGPITQLEAAAAAMGARIVDRHGLSLDEIFVAQVGAA